MTWLSRWISASRAFDSSSREYLALPLLIFSRRAPKLPPKHRVQILRRFKPTTARNVGNHRVGIFQAAGGRCQFETQDLVVHAAASLGAEMQALKTSDGKDLLWNGDAAYWTGRSPILFPIVGKAADDTVLIDGRFRLACFLTVLLRTTRPVRVLWDDYSDRTAYHRAETLCPVLRHHGRMAEFHVEPQMLAPKDLPWVVEAFVTPH